jgi:uncharacterized protein (DUF2236 family)
VTLTQRINAERLVVLGWGRAILLQLAHPLVAAGVAGHSTFRDTPASRILRLHATIQAMLAINFGSAAQQQSALDRIKAIHDRVHGTLDEAAGRFPAGTPYSAHDPELLVWVDATLRESLPMAYELFVAPLSPAERDEYCAEGDDIAAGFGIPPGVRPRSCTELSDYMSQMFSNGSIAVTAVAREMARDVIAPPYGRAVWPASRVNRLATIGLLPQSLRDGYGFSWTADDERSLQAWARRIRAVRRVCPARLALWPAAVRKQKAEG